MKSSSSKKKPSRLKKIGKWAIELLIIAAIIMGIRAYQQYGMAEGIAPDFTAQTLTGETVHLSDFKGAPFLLHFWSPDCIWCKLEKDAMTSLAEDWPVLVISFHSGGEEEIQRYVNENGLDTWNIVADSNFDIGRLYGVTGTPSSFVIDADGKIRFTEIGPTTGWGLRLRLYATEVL